MRYNIRFGNKRKANVTSFYSFKIKSFAINTWYIKPTFLFHFNHDWIAVVHIRCGHII